MVALIIPSADSEEKCEFPYVIKNNDEVSGQKKQLSITIPSKSVFAGKVASVLVRDEQGIELFGFDGIVVHRDSERKKKDGVAVKYTNRRVCIPEEYRRLIAVGQSYLIRLVATTQPVHRTRKQSPKNYWMVGQDLVAFRAVISRHDSVRENKNKKSRHYELFSVSIPRQLLLDFEFFNESVKYTFYISTDAERQQLVEEFKRSSDKMELYAEFDSAIAKMLCRFMKEGTGIFGKLSFADLNDMVDAFVKRIIGNYASTVERMGEKVRREDFDPNWAGFKKHSDNAVARVRLEKYGEYESSKLDAVVIEIFSPSQLPLFRQLVTNTYTWCIFSEALELSRFYFEKALPEETSELVVEYLQRNYSATDSSLYFKRI